MENAEKEQEKLRKDIEKLKNQLNDVMKIKLKKVEINHEMEIKLLKKAHNKELLIFAIESYLNIDRKVNCEPYASEAGVHPRTFMKKAEYYSEYKVLPPHGNKGKTPHNKTPNSVVKAIREETLSMLLGVENYTKRVVPMIMRYLKNNVLDALSKKGKKIDVSLSTFRRIVETDEVGVELKYTTKKGKTRKRVINVLKDKIQKSIQQLAESNIVLEAEAISKQILWASSKKKEILKQKISPRRFVSKGGIILQWDGSLDYFANGTKVTRLHVICHKTLKTLAIYFVEHENNKSFQMALSQVIDEYGVPEKILGDRRKGVNPVDQGALNAIICDLLGIELDLASDSVHKAELESLNGKMHAIVPLYCYRNNIQTIEELNRHSGKIKDDVNKHFGKMGGDFSNMRQTTDEKRDIIRGEIKQIKISQLNAIVYKRRVYQPYKGKKVADLNRGAWAIVSLDKGMPKKLWTREGIFVLREVTNEIKADFLIEDQIYEITKKRFGGEPVMLMNEETFDAYYRSALKMGEKNIINNKKWKLDSQIKEQLETLQGFNEIKELKRKYETLLEEYEYVKNKLRKRIQ